MMSTRSARAIALARFAAAEIRSCCSSSISSNCPARSSLDGYSIVVCRECGAAFADRIPEQAVFDDYYREFSKYEGGEPEAARPPETEKRFEDAASFVAGFIPSLDARILEIGCGFGQFLWVLRQRGFTNLLGADPSPGCARAARKFYGIHVTDRTVFTLERPETPYEFLTLIGVMEHIRDLDRTVERFHELLSPTGRVYLEVPDASRLDPGMDAPFQEFSVEHLNYFSPLSLNNLMTQRGFRVVASGRALRRCTKWRSLPPTASTSARPSLPAWVRDDETEPGLSAYIEGCRARTLSFARRSAAPFQRAAASWSGVSAPIRCGCWPPAAWRSSGLRPLSIPTANISSATCAACASSRPASSAPDRRSSSLRVDFKREIHDQIRNRLGLANPVILLYDSV